MKTISCQELLRNLSTHTQGALFYFFGDETFLIDEAVRRLAAEILGKPNDFNWVTVDGDETEVAGLVDLVNTLPLGCKRRVLVIRRADEFSAKDLENLLPLISNPAEHTCLVFRGGEGIDARRKFFKEFEKKGLLVEAEPLKGKPLQDWIDHLAKQRGYQLEPQARELMEFLVGSSLAELDQAMERLTLLAGEQKKINKDLVASALADTREGVIWDLTDALGGRDRRRAFLALRRILRQRDTSNYLLVVGALAGFYRRLLILKTAKTLRKGQGEIIAEAGISPGAIYMNQRFADAFSQDELVRALEAISRADRKLKSSGMAGDLVLWELALRLLSTCSDAGRPTRGGKSAAMHGRAG